MEKEIKGLISSFDLSVKFNNLKIKAILNVLEKTNPELKNLYESELYQLCKDFEASLSTDQLKNYESFGFHFPVSD